MSLEIEKKYLINNHSEKLLNKIDNAESMEITQHYLKVEKNVEQRIRKITSEEGTKYFLTTKTKIDENLREENEVIIDEMVYELLKELSLGKIAKERFIIPLTEQLTAEVDFFYNKELVILEVEFESKEQFNSFDISLISDFDNDNIKDVTTDPKYKNAYIALNKL